MSIRSETDAPRPTSPSGDCPSPFAGTRQAGAPAAPCYRPPAGEAATAAGGVPASAPRVRHAGLLGWLCLGAAAALYGWLCHTPPENGWRMRRWDNSGFLGAPAAERAVPEPFEAEEATQPFSAEWTAWFRVEEPRRYEFTLEADDRAELFIDERAVVAAPPNHARASFSGTVKLSPGVHAARIRLSDSGGGKYLRLFFSCPDVAHGWMPVPWPRRMAWPTEAEALRGASPMREPARAAWFAAALMLATVGASLAWRSRAVAAGRPVLSGRELALAILVFALAFGARSFDLSRADIHWDEPAYVKAGMHFVRNAQLRDIMAESFRWNNEHPPIAKWLYGLAELGGGMPGAKLLAAFLQSLTCVLAFLLGRRYGSLAVGAAAGGFLALMPYFYAHGRIAGLESPLTFFVFLASALLLLACERQSALLHFAWGLTSVLGVGSRATGVWFAPVALVVCALAFARGARRPWPYLASVAGAAAGVALIYGAWPWIWGDPRGQAMITYGHWRDSVPQEWVLGTFQHPPVWYYGFAFLVVTPVLMLLLLAAWVPQALRRRSLFDAFLFASLVFPFGQSLSPMRQDGARYVIQVFPAVALAAAWGAIGLAQWLRRPRAGPALAGVSAVYLAGWIAWMHPYELDVCSEWTGGTAAVIRRRWLEIPFWGEGQRELADVINALAPPGSTVRIWMTPSDDFPGLRPDLVRDDSPNAQFLLRGFFQFPPEPAGYVLVHDVKAGGGRIGGIYRKVVPPG